MVFTVRHRAHYFSRSCSQQRESNNDLLPLVLLGSPKAWDSRASFANGGGSPADRKLIAAFLISRYNPPIQARRRSKINVLETRDQNIPPSSYFGLECDILEYVRQKISLAKRV